MRYSKTHVNEIIDQILNSIDDDSFSVPWDEIELIREEHRLVDRRKSSIPTYRTEIVRDFMEFKLSYKELMAKYHCSQRTMRSLLLECAEDDERVYAEMELRRH